MGGKRLLAIGGALIIAAAVALLWRASPTEPTAPEPSPTAESPVDAPSDTASDPGDEAAPDRVRPEVVPPPEPPLDPDVIVRLTDEDGNAVRKAVIRAYRAYAHDRGHRSWGSVYIPGEEPEDALAEGVSGSDGVCGLTGFETGPLRIEMHAAGYARAEARTLWIEGAPDCEVDVVLQPGHELAGTVLRADGSPAAARQVTVATRGDSFGPSSPIGHFHAETDAAGRFSVSGLFPAVYDVWTRDFESGATMLGAVAIPDVSECAFTLPRGGELRGIVRDAETGAGIEGAVVAFHGGFGFNDAPMCRAQTGPDGRFSFQPLDDHVQVGKTVVSAPGYAPSKEEEYHDVLRPGMSQEFTFELDRAVTLTGLVTGPDGPVEGARVRAYYATGDHFEPYADRSALSGVDGRYVIEDLPTLTLAVVAECDGFSDPHHAASPWGRSRGGFDNLPEERRPVGEPGATLEVDIELSAEVETEEVVTVTLSGRLLTPEGEPAAYARVWMAGSRRKVYDRNIGETYTLADGTFRVQGTSTPDYFQLYAHLDGVGELRHIFEDELRSDQDGLEFRLDVLEHAPRLLSGVVLLPDGSPAAHATLRVAQCMSGTWGAWDTMRGTRAAADGTFGFGVAYVPPSMMSSKTPYPQPEIVLLATSPGHAWVFSDPISIEDDAQLPTVVVLRLGEAQSVDGRALDETGTPVAGAAIRLSAPSRGFGIGGGGWPPTMSPDVRGAVVATTDTDGKFRLTGLAPLEFQVTAQAPGHLSASELVTLPLTQPVELRLQRARDLRLLVVDVDGNPVANAEVSTVVEGREWANDIGTTNADGSFVMYDRGPDALRLLVVCEREGGSDHAPALFDVSRSDRDLTLTLPRGGSLSGVVTDRDGTPLPELSLRVEWQGDEPYPSGWTQTDDDGRYAFRGLADGPYTLTLSREELTESITDVRPGDTLDLMPAGSGSLSGRVRFPDLIGRSVTLRIESVEPSQRTYSTECDNDGHFRIDGLPQGSFRISANTERGGYVGDTGPWECVAPVVAETGNDGVVITMRRPE